VHRATVDEGVIADLFAVAITAEQRNGTAVG
jgi:hypothetical protein